MANGQLPGLGSNEKDGVAEPGGSRASAHWATAGESRGQDQRHVVPLNRTTQALAWYGALAAEHKHRLERKCCVKAIKQYLLMNELHLWSGLPVCRCSSASAVTPSRLNRRTELHTSSSCI
ncbi:hypothetical protein EYF80_006165 [Liparis tanakae]|uniref:Uncharacterized protein n=1 Tax=Liparis tanakae TaxID=230148 RepID=A0A4Z2J0T8_9TELE|nr:hypothetical protein EYF80_006165 [Liparis tanakae]